MSKQAHSIFGLTQGLQTAGPLIGRLMIATIFLMSGLAKVSAPAVMVGVVQAAGLPFPVASLTLSILVELVGGVLLVTGFKARPVAIVLAGFSLVTALVFHSKVADQNQLMHFLKNIAIAGGLLQVAAFGAGPISLDARFSTRPPSPALTA